jgi:diguanylate cyclase (GGDEF)-like protein
LASDDIDRELADLRTNFIRNSARRLEDLSRFIDILAESPSDSPVLNDILREFHGLAGLGTTFGFAGVTSIARAAELECNAALSDLAMVPEVLDRCRKAVEHIQRELTTGGAPDTRPRVDSESRPGTIDVVLLEDDPDGHAVATAMLERQGMKVRGAYTRADALRLIEERLPQALICDILVPDGTGYDVVEHLRSRPGGQVPPAIITSGLHDFIDKVEAIRSGADAFFEKPLDWPSVVQTLEHLLRRAEDEAPRVLYIANQGAPAEFVESVLESAGYQVRVVSDPRHLDIDLSSFRPDIVLVDAMLPEVTGRHLAPYIRQKQSAATLPVVILGPVSVEEEIASIRAGVDDYLSAPVHPGLLLAFVEARIERSRYLRNLIEHDGLTGLLTHSAFMRRIKISYEDRSRKPEKPPTLVFGDLDHFKKINDTFGHPVGDRVLASLGSLLRKRMRRSDVVARYGGEEFAIVLNDLSADEALRLIDRIRQEFGGLEHHDDKGGIFHVTFSAGVAPLREDMTVESWKIAADQMLYSAKAQGRNRAILG